MQRQNAASDEKWTKRCDEQSKEWETRPTNLVHEVAKQTDDKIKAAIEASEQRTKDIIDNLKMEMTAQLSDARSSAPSLGAPVGDGTSSSAQRGRWNPSCLEIKDFAR